MNETIENLPAGDPALNLMAQAAAEHARAVQNLADELADARSRLQAASETSQRAEQVHQEALSSLQVAQAEAAANRQRAAVMAEQLKKIHGSLFSQNVPDLILKACLQLTNSKRGWYIQADRAAADGTPGPLTIKVVASQGGNTQLDQTLHAFLQVVCTKVLEENVPLGSGSPGADLPLDAPLPGPVNSQDGAHPPRDWLAAPAVLLGKPMGVVLVADKIDGDFNDGDLDMLVSVGDQATVAVENARLHQRLEDAYISTIRMLADAMEAKDPHTHGHCEEVATYARLTAVQLGLESSDIAIVCFTALLHDIGKIGVSDGVLHKPGPLLPEERTLVQAHVRIGRDLVARVPSLSDVGKAIYHHHESWDGDGYPENLKGEAIPIASRIVAVVDAYCAMTSRRSYKEAYAEADAREELRRCTGTQFEPRIVEAFLAVLDNAESQAIINSSGNLPDFSTRNGACGMLSVFYN